MLDGIEYYLPGTGDFSAGDRVSAKVPPKSKKILKIETADHIGGPFTILAAME